MVITANCSTKRNPWWITLVFDPSPSVPYNSRQRLEPAQKKTRETLQRFPRLFSDGGYTVASFYARDWRGFSFCMKPPLTVPESIEHQTVVVFGKRQKFFGWVDADTIWIEEGKYSLIQPHEHTIDIQKRNLFEVSKLEMGCGQWEIGGEKKEGEEWFINGISLRDIVESEGAKWHEDNTIPGHYIFLQDAIAGTAIPNVSAVAWFYGLDDHVLLESFTKIQNPIDAGTLGKWRHADGFNLVWTDGRYWILADRDAARLCIQHLAERNAIDQLSAIPFEELDAHIRAGTLRGKPPGAQRLRDYFKDGKDAQTDYESLFKLMVREIYDPHRVHLAVA